MSRLHRKCWLFGPIRCLKEDQLVYLREGVWEELREVVGKVVWVFSQS